MIEILVLNPAQGLCSIGGQVHEVKLNLDEPVKKRVRQLLDKADGGVYIELALDASGKGRVVSVR